MMKTIPLFLVLSVVLFACGCSGNVHKMVHVIDSGGAPIQGASVEAVSLSINSAPNFTDAKGEVTLPSNIQETQWVAVSKPGYKSVQVDVPTAWPLWVTLVP